MAGRPTAKIVLQQVKPILSVDRCEAKGGVLKRYEAPCSLPDFNTLNENTNQIILNGQVLNIKTSYKNQCKYCPKSFRKSSDLKRHIRTHTGERPFKCNICEKGFSLKKTLNIHQNVHQMIIKHQCSVCGIYDSTKSSLTEHMRLHTDSPLALDTNPYVCPFCPLDFQTIDQRTSHLHEHDKEVSETGILPNDVTTRKAKMAVFMKHFNNILKMQDIKKENKENSTHSENSQVKTIEKAVDSNNGEFIQFENSQKQTFESIVDSNNGEFIQFENSQPKTSESIVDSNNVEFIHFVLETNENGEVLSLKPVSDMLLVDQIDQSAKFDETTKECIPNFLREKTDKEMFDCQTCSKKFRTKNALTRHQRTHTAQYNCEQCNKKFVLKSSLSRHLEKHFNNRPFACKLCPSFYTRIGNLKIHLRKDHNITDTQKPLPVPDYNSDETYIDVVN